MTLDSNARHRIADVAQIFNLLYRRIAFGRAWDETRRPAIRRWLADCKSAIQQSAILRYGVLDRRHEQLRSFSISSDFGLRISSFGFSPP
jgi:hypothetical protein